LENRTSALLKSIWDSSKGAQRQTYLLDTYLPNLESKRVFLSSLFHAVKVVCVLAKASSQID